MDFLNHLCPQKGSGDYNKGRFLKLTQMPEEVFERTRVPIWLRTGRRDSISEELNVAWVRELVFIEDGDVISVCHKVFPETHFSFG